ncbi:phosphoribosylglycinamide formyltransferase [Erysipelothrix urinaevulpis]|uniref:phosphoribosylglycinamide formyltransferase n=1 Tax=Erysipelothrix urinaevulpis TaxID=2683717 RepID=UPI00135C0D78|nr:phosphoribosylglycinamide formyltransferase [Erysipelothrix urinaevulpis]
MPKNIAVFVSGNGSNLQSLIDHQGQDYVISLVISNNPNAYALKRAHRENIAVLCFDGLNYQSVYKALANGQIDFIVLAGYLKIVPKTLIDQYENRMINIHPSLLPSFSGKGFYGIKVHQAVLKKGVKVTGATTHFVSEVADEGPIIMQEVVQICPHETAESLQEKVLDIEYKILLKSLTHLCRNELHIHEKKVIIGGKNDKNSTRIGL